MHHSLGNQVPKSESSDSIEFSAYPKEKISQYEVDFFFAFSRNDILITVIGQLFFA